jgi:hypothetical protein
MFLCYDFMCILVYLLVYVLGDNEYDAFLLLALSLILVSLIFDMNCVFQHKSSDLMKTLLHM